jgi:formylglycine-generating enzyme required for sulfatase activity
MIATLRRAVVLVFAIGAMPVLAAEPFEVFGPATRPVVDKIPHTTVQIDMIRVPGGRMTVKDKDGRPTVYDIEPFMIQRTEARWDEWDVFYLGLDIPDEADQSNLERGRLARERRDAMLKPSPSPYAPYDGGFGHEGWPVQGITLHTVRKYIEWLNRTTGKQYRLPTEVEWEWACRAGSREPVRPTGKALEHVAWFAGNSEEAPNKVGTKAPNAWGLHDMLGNVAEWVIRSDESAVLAGGSYQDEAKDVHGDAREVPDDRKLQRTHPDTPRPIRIWLSDGTHVGFRLVRDLDRDEERAAWDERRAEH